MKRNVISRLSIIKYLYNIALSQSYKSSSFSSLSILSVHDAVEMFLIIVAEQKGNKTKDARFMKYWELISELTHKEEMWRFNELRNSIKHSGRFFDKIEIDTARQNVINFLEENCRNIFRGNFNEISLIKLIEFPETRKYLEEAENLLKQDILNEALNKVAIAFSVLFKEHYTEKRYSLNITSKLMTSPFFYHLDNLSDNNLARAAKNIIKQFIKVLDDFQHQIKLMSLGIDINKFNKFMYLTPSVSISQAGVYRTYSKNVEISKDDIQYCIDFVIECAINLQQTE